MKIIDRNPNVPNDANFRVKTKENYYFYTKDKPTIDANWGWALDERVVHVEEVSEYDTIDWKDSLVGLIPVKYCNKPKQDTNMKKLTPTQQIKVLEFELRQATKHLESAERALKYKEHLIVQYRKYCADKLETI